jgi:hypothetical protein
MRCRALSNKGKQCRNGAVGEYSFSGDSEMDSYQHVGWVLVPFCARHVKELDETGTHIQKMARFRKERSAAIRRSNAGKERQNRSK